MSEECSVLGKNEIHVQNFGRETWSEEAIRRTRRMWENNNLMDHMEIRLEWIKRALDEVQWRALVNMIINLQIPYKLWYLLNS
jgi:hypothetical protein